MKLFFAAMFVLLLSLVFINCNDNDNVTDSGSSGSNLICVKIDIQLYNTLVIVIFNDNVYFDSYVKAEAILSRPNASFTTYLPRGTNKCKVKWLVDGQSYHSASTDVYFGKLEKYYMGISVYSDSLIVNIQETPFMYQ